MTKPKPDLATLQRMLNNMAVEQNHSHVVVDHQQTAPTASVDSPPVSKPRKKPLPSLRSKALQYLSRRDYARTELQQKLLPLTENPDEITTILDDFTARGWLSDTRFAEQWAHQRGVRYGAQRLKHELRMKGVADETIAVTLEDISDTEEARARAVWARKFGTPPADIKEKTRQLRFLAARGFSLDIIYKVVAGCDEYDD